MNNYTIEEIEAFKQEGARAFVPGADIYKLNPYKKSSNGVWEERAGYFFDGFKQAWNESDARSSEE